MNGLAHLLDKTVFPVQPLIVPIALIVWIVAAIPRVRSRLKFFPQKYHLGLAAAGMVFVGIIGAEFALVAFVEHEAWHEMVPQLYGEIESVTVDGIQIGDSGPLVAALRNMQGTIGHHSHPTTSHVVVLTTSRGSLPLNLKRDSEDPDEYWVFYPFFQITRFNAVGHAFTDAMEGM